MPRYTMIEKVVGETPLQALERFRASDPSYQDVPMTYAGRLDPMASGMLLILMGDECKQREKYDGLDKIYDFEIVLGASSDSDDVLGIPHRGEPFSQTEAEIQTAVMQLIGTHQIPYPAFSSKTVDGKALHEYARANVPITRPIRSMTVHEAAYKGLRKISAEDLLKEICATLALLSVPPTSDFRIERVLSGWQEALVNAGDFLIVSAAATVSAGTYIRSLAPFVAEKLGTSGLAYKIHRRAILLP
jgi:tRNA pseudouridine(55) synthase